MLNVIQNQLFYMHMCKYIKPVCISIFLQVKGNYTVKNSFYSCRMIHIVD